MLGYPRTICGERVAAVGGALVAVASDDLPIATGTPSRVLYVDTRTGTIRRYVKTAAEVLDFVAVPG